MEYFEMFLPVGLLLLLLLLSHLVRGHRTGSLKKTLFFLLFFFSSPFSIFALLISLPPINSRNSDPGSHSRLSPPPLLPTTVRALL